MGLRKSRRKQRRVKPSFSLFKSLFIILIVSSQLAAVVFFSYYPENLFKPEASLPDQTIATHSQADNYSYTDHFGEQVINIILLGFDRFESDQLHYLGCRPDTIMIASINVRTAKASLLSIPRDSYVKIHGTEKHDKINHSYMYGYFGAANDEDPHDSGIKTTIQTVRDFLGGVPIHNYIILDMDNASSIVDSIGGVYYDVDIEVRSLSGWGSLLLEKGYQHLDGSQFMTYVRCRASDQGGERGRTERSQKIIIALFNQFKKEGRLSDLPGLYRSVNRNIVTNLSFAQIVALSVFAVRVNPTEIKTEVFRGQGQFSYRNGQTIWYLLIDEEERADIIAKVFGITPEKRILPFLPGPFYPARESAPEPEEAPELDDGNENEEPEEVEKEIIDLEI